MDAIIPVLVPVPSTDRRGTGQQNGPIKDGAPLSSVLRGPIPKLSGCWTIGQSRIPSYTEWLRTRCQRHCDCSLHRQTYPPSIPTYLPTGTFNPNVPAMNTNRPTARQHQVRSRSYQSHPGERSSSPTQVGRNLGFFTHG